MNTLINFSAPAGRFLIALIFLMSGVNKIFSYAGTQGYMEAMGVPGFLLPLVIITEVVGALAIILGWNTRIAALALAGFSLLSAVLFHADFSDQIQMIMFMKNIAIAGGFLILIATGPGSYALDNRAKA
ncbi:DoxX family protein [Thalassomonas viridans]|uniref:DoxX family protein n=1 Tax=Thalassomonas viridans TaxID=137584 RepID=A0AAE9Z6B2_9GAMM|nr:DoxX family protein [Thalassomonas viridans]WDE07398.1 DoxX family protein [Thalassomonas viridans]